MVFLAQGPGPFVSRRDVHEYSRTGVESGYSNKIAILSNICNKNQIQPLPEIAAKVSLKRFDFSSSLFLNFSEGKLTSFEGPPAAEALLAFSAWIQ